MARVRNAAATDITHQCRQEADASYDGDNAIQSDKIIFPLYVMKLMRVTEVLNLWCCAQFPNFTCNGFLLISLGSIFYPYVVRFSLRIPYH